MIQPEQPTSVHLNGGIKLLFFFKYTDTNKIITPVHFLPYGDDFGIKKAQRMSYLKATIISGYFI